MAKWQNIKSQIIASTVNDSQGETSTKEFLDKLCKLFSYRERITLHQKHDMSLDTVGFVENFKVIQSTSSEKDWNLVGDINFHDIELDEALKGISYSMTEDMIGETSKKSIAVYLPFPLYKNDYLINDLFLSDDGLVVGAWRKKAASPEQVALIFSVVTFLIGPAYNEFWNSKISPLINRVMIKMGLGFSVDFVQTTEGFKGEQFGIYFIPVRGKESESFEGFRIEQAFKLVSDYLDTDESAKKIGVHLVKLICTEPNFFYELRTIEYLDGTSVSNPSRNIAT